MLRPAKNVGGGSPISHQNLVIISQLMKPVSKITADRHFKLSQVTAH
jgi:hypothetical protein